VYSDNISEYITNALSPTKVTSVQLNEATKKAVVQVPEDQLSIAIGKGGQNVRLASKLTDYELDIEADKSSVVAPAPEEEPAQVPVEAAPAPKPAPVAAPQKPQAPKLKKKSELESSLLEAIEEHGE